MGHRTPPHSRQDVACPLRTWRGPDDVQLHHVDPSRRVTLAERWRTTGATILSDLDTLPASIHVWRRLLQWLGGMGIIVLFVAILPMLGFGGRQLYKAETPGPMKDTQLTPRIASTAKRLWLLCAGLTLLCALFYRVAGMSWLDAVVQSFATLSLGGFSTHDASYGFFNSPMIEAVTIIFMLIAGMNFAALSDYQIWMLSLAMLLGRLASFTVMVIFTPSFWRR